MSTDRPPKPPPLEELPAPAPWPRTLVLPLIAVWFLSIAGPLSLLLPCLALAFVWGYAVQRRFLAIALLLLLSPSGLAFCQGVWEYSRGDARLIFIGHPAGSIGRLDRDYRCYRFTWGCIFDGSEWTKIVPHNAAIKLLVFTFGPVRGSYTGPYPTLEEAKRALQAAEPVAIDDFKQNQFSLGQEVIQLDARVGEQLVEGMRGQLCSFDPPLVTGALWQNECVILRMQEQRDWEEEEPPRSFIVLLSRTAGRPFSYYSEGRYDLSAVPVSWRRGQ
jgi:hypothetical protein